MEAPILSCALLRSKMVLLLYFDSQNRFSAKEQFVRLFNFNQTRAKMETYIISLCLQKYSGGGREGGDWCNPGFMYKLQN